MSDITFTIQCSNCTQEYDGEQCPNCGYIEGQPIDLERPVGQRLLDAFEDLDYE